MKIFCVGLSRTGTSSVNKALRILGYHAKHYPALGRLYFLRLQGIRRKELRRYDALSDIAVLRFYKKLDKQFSGSRFIQTVREKESWLNSCADYLRQKRGVATTANARRLRIDIYGVPDFDRDMFSAAYDRHLADVKEYFNGRERDLLTMNIVEGDGWHPLCEFLGNEVPDVAFPRENAQRG